MPPLGPACLMAYLRQERTAIDCQFLDLNLDYYYWLTSPGIMKDSFERCFQWFDKVRKVDKPWSGYISLVRDFTEVLQCVSKTLLSTHSIPELMQNQAVVENFEDYKAVRRALKNVCLMNSLIWKKDFDNYNRQENPFQVHVDDLLYHSKYFLDVLGNDSSNPYAAYLDTHAELAEMVAWADFVCVTVNFQEQMLGGYSIAGLVKRMCPGLPVVAGGSWLTGIRERILDIPELFDHVDAVFPYSGEASIVEAVGAVASGKEPKSCSCVIFREGDRVVFSDNKRTVPIHKLPVPDFDPFPLDRYLLPNPKTLPVQLTRGCYWGKCTFCTHHLAQGERFALPDPDAVGSKLKTLMKRYDTNNFYFVDEAIPPGLLRRLPEIFQKHRIEINWLTESRLEESMDGELFERLKRIGCRMMLFGLETGNERIRDLMGKGVSNETAQRCIRQCADAGIYTNLFLMVGFPGETVDEVLDTFTFVRENSDYIDSVGISTFNLEPHSPVSMAPEDYGITILDGKYEGVPISMSLDYSVQDGLGSGEANMLSRKFESSKVFTSIAARTPYPRREVSLYVPPRWRYI